MDQIRDIAIGPLVVDYTVAQRSREVATELAIPVREGAPASMPPAAKGSPYGLLRWIAVTLS
ncbi:MAG: hypothetical protein HC888_14290 [Candidatus Competibacteraceae bacterium]|nr:hypothetical protein [Candidatus Competibacteraceae bacterium]